MSPHTQQAGDGTHLCTLGVGRGGGGGRGCQVISVKGEAGASPSVMRDGGLISAMAFAYNESSLKETWLRTLVCTATAECGSSARARVCCLCATTERVHLKASRSQTSRDHPSDV